MCQKKAAVICWLINELPLTKDGKPSSYKQYLHGSCEILSPAPHSCLPLLQTTWAGCREPQGGPPGWGVRSFQVQGEISLPSLPTLACPRGIDRALYSIKEHQTASGSKPAPTQATGSAVPPPAPSSSHAHARELGLRRIPRGEGGVPHSPTPTPTLKPGVSALLG